MPEGFSGVMLYKMAFFCVFCIHSSLKVLGVGNNCRPTLSCTSGGMQNCIFRIGLFQSHVFTLDSGVAVFLVAKMIAMKMKTTIKAIKRSVLAFFISADGHASDFQSAYG